MEPRNIDIKMDQWTINNKTLKEFSITELVAIKNNLGIVISGINSEIKTRE